MKSLFTIKYLSEGSVVIIKKSDIGKVALGAAIGAGLGILFAPKKGSETREDLKNKIKEIPEKVKNLNPKKNKKEKKN